MQKLVVLRAELGVVCHLPGEQIELVGVLLLCGEFEAAAKAMAAGQPKYCQ